MVYKYQYLFDEFQLADCPGENVEAISLKAYRFSHTPITHPWNFLPNIEYYKAKKMPPRIIEKRDLCGYCNLSFYRTESGAKKELERYRKGLEKKHKPLVDVYSDIAVGEIELENGVAKKTTSDHFGFYEYVGCDFKNSFEILKNE